MGGRDAQTPSQNLQSKLENNLKKLDQIHDKVSQGGVRE